MAKAPDGAVPSSWLVVLCHPPQPPRGAPAQVSEARQLQLRVRPCARRRRVEAPGGGDEVSTATWDRVGRVLHEALVFHVFRVAIIE